MSDLSHALSPTERKRIQRQRDKAAGWSEISVKVAAEHAEAVRTFAASLPAPRLPKDPAQIDLIAELDRRLTASASRSDPSADQGSLL